AVRRHLAARAAARVRRLVAWRLDADHDRLAGHLATRSRYSGRVCRSTIHGMDRARRHQRLLSGLAFGLLALVAELVGRSLTYRLDVGRHVSSPDYATASYYPFLLAAVKVGIGLLLASLAWRVARADVAARAARRLLAAVGSRPSRVPRIRVVLSPRLWLASFFVTSLFYLVQTDVERLSTGQLPLLSPWLHTSALPVF